MSSQPAVATAHIDPVSLSRRRRVHRRVLLAVWLVAVSALACAATAAASARPASCAARHWVASWSASPSGPVFPIDTSATPILLGGGQTVRNVISPHLGGTVLRLHLTNRYGHAPITFSHVTVARASTGPAAQPGTVTMVTFAGHASVTVPAGSDLVSDPVSLALKAFQPLLVSIYVDHYTTSATEHWVAMSTQYLTPIGAGDHTDDVNGTAFTQRTTSWIYLDGLDVQAPDRVGALVAFGDSITDGYVAGDPAILPADPAVLNQNERYPDDLQHRIDAAHLPLSVINAGISMNMVARSFYLPFAGPSSLSRVSADAIDQAGITTAIIQEGINDLGFPPFATVPQVEQALTELIAKFHAAGVRVLLGTLLPASNAILDGDPLLNSDSEAEREQINTWIRTQHLADGVIDFDAALRNPANPATLLPADSGPDHLHPSAAGYQAMANTINLNQLATPRCSTTTPRHATE